MNTSEKDFVATVWDFYRVHGRHELPWRKNQDPYRVLVSELMLQQTQVLRVIPKYEAFIKKWPTVKALAKASLAEVLQMWQGLGYNRRAKYLLEVARVVSRELNGHFPSNETNLKSLPGIGPYTAGAIMAFSYNEPVILIETNVRQVYIHHFFKRKNDVTEAEIRERLIRTLPENEARDWYAALMDYGSHLKRVHGNLTKQSVLYRKQSKFKGSNREVRGAILRAFTTARSLTKKQLLEKLQFEEDKISEQLIALEKEGLLSKQKTRYMLPT